MSSPIHSARCVGRRGATVDVELEPTTACGPHFPLSRFFALALLHECANAIVYRSPGVVWRWSGAPTALGSAISQDEIIDLCGEPSGDERKRTLADTFIRDVQYVLTANWAPARGDLDEVFERAVREGTSRPSAIMRIEVADEQWVAHVERGMRWDVYAFDDDAPNWPVLT